MANPNLLSITSIYGNTTYLIPGVSQTLWSALTPSANQIFRLNTLLATNVTATAANITVTFWTGVAATGTANRMAYNLAVPANATLVIVDKSNMVYIGETNSITAISGTASAIELVASYEAIS
jgi:type IV pilus biogenesis protein CpaD/CtpE